MKPLTYREYLDRLQGVCIAKGLPIEYVGTVATGDYFRTTYPLYRVSIRRPSSNQMPVAFVAGIHGDEAAGPLGVLEFLEKVYPPESRGAICPVYPMVNPWGFDHARRQNAYGIDINRTCGSLDNPTDEARAVMADMSRQRFDYLHTLHEDNRLSGFYVYYSDDRRRWLAERFVTVAQQANMPVNSTARDLDNRVRIYGGLVAYNHSLFPKPEKGCPLEDFWLGRGIQHFVTETPMQADLWVRARVNAELMRTTWMML